jgi:CubicO group peptidase (beta-lactamase class C family)
MIAVFETRTSRLLCIFLLFVAVPACLARADRVDDYAREQMRLRHIPGLALAVVREGRVVKESGYGLASVELEVPVTPSTVFEIGSISKQITAAAVMMLVEEGKVSLNDRISKYIAESPQSWRGVTVRHLLTHTSGLRNYSGLPGFALSEHLNRAEFVKRIGAYPPSFTPGEAHSYGNINYNLLGYIVEQASGKGYWRFVSERIFKPLGMHATRDRDPRSIIKNRAQGYEREDDQLVGRDHSLTDVFSAGAIVSTVQDLEKWEAGFVGGKLLKRSSIEQIWTPVRLNSGVTYPYGFGWYMETLRGHPVRRHTGQTAGFTSSIALFPEDRLAVIVLCNIGTGGVAGRIGQTVAKLYVPALSLRTLEIQPDGDMQTVARLHELIERQLAGEANSAMLTKEARDSLATDPARANWQRIAAYGSLRKFDFVGRDIDGYGGGLFYRAEVGEHLLLLKFVLNGAGKISELSLEEEE